MLPSQCGLLAGGPAVRQQMLPAHHCMQPSRLTTMPNLHRFEPNPSVYPGPWSRLSGRVDARLRV